MLGLFPARSVLTPAHPSQDRASKLVGMRLEKHMDKIREQYQAQKAEEEEKRQRYNSPHVARHELEHSQEHTPSVDTRSSHRYSSK